MTKTPQGDELKAGWKEENPSKIIKKTDIGKHKTKQDLWITIHGKVYDVTEYLKDHPGGPEPLIEIAGQDATSAYEDVGHSEDAREILHSFLIGDLEGYKAEDSSDKKPEPKLAGVIVEDKRPETSEQQGLLPRVFNSQTELLTLACGAAGLLYTANVWHILPSVAKAMSGSHNNFVLGYTTAAFSFGAVGIVCGRHLAKASNRGPGDFASYPAHIASTTIIGRQRPGGALNPSEYRRFKLRSKEELADQIWRFVFDLPTKHSILGLPIGQHVAVKGSIDDHTIVRSYTPVSNNRDFGRLELLVRVYPEGKLGNYLKNAKEGSDIEMRGPKGAMKYRRDMSRRIGMVGGGTGITPLFQIIRAVCEDKNDKTQVDLIYGNRSESDIMLKSQLDEYARENPDKFKVYYVLENPGANWKGGKGRVDKDLIKQLLPQPDRDNKAMLCGPPGMVKAMVKSLVDLGYEQPGSVSKMSDQIFCF